jgi:tetratricopeptide (TPR) repeat protein
MSHEDVASDYVVTSRARENLAKLAKVETQCRTDVRLYMLKAFNEQVLEQPDDAIAAYREALLIQNRPEIYTAIAEVQVAQGRISEAVDNYAIAIRYRPSLEAYAGEEIARQVRERLRAGR